MQLMCVGSGSDGNCYILDNGKEALIIECGMTFGEVKKMLKFDVSRIVGCVVSHEHKDHSKYIDQFAKAGIKVYLPYVNRQKVVKFGGFEIRTFELNHDVECYGFFIKCHGYGNIVYISDTGYCRYKFNHVEHFIVEANYSFDRINEEEVYAEHIIRGHMEIGTTCEFLKNSVDFNTKGISICHLSSLRADSSDFSNKVYESVGFRPNVLQNGFKREI